MNLYEFVEYYEFIAPLNLIPARSLELEEFVGSRRVIGTAKTPSFLRNSHIFA